MTKPTHMPQKRSERIKTLLAIHVTTTKTTV